MQRAHLPQLQITITTGGVPTVYTNVDFIDGRITRNENNFDTAILDCGDMLSKNYPTQINSGSLILIEVKDASDALWTTIFNGVILQANMNCDTKNAEVLQLHCSGSGYGFKMCPINTEYGDQSVNATLNSLQKIITDSGAGIVPKYVNKILGGSVSSGYSYTADATTVQDITGDVPYIGFPYKPCHKALQDLCDLLQAIKGTNAGPHWIVTTDMKLLMTTVGNHHAGAVSNGWTTYYGGSQAKATLEQGLDFISFNLQKLMPEANYIIYYGVWRRPSGGDGWTEGNAANWLIEDAAPPNNGSIIVLSDDASVHQVGSKSLAAINTSDPPVGIGYYSWPHNKAAAWNFNIGTNIKIPFLSFWVRTSDWAVGQWYVRLCTDSSNYFEYYLTPDLTVSDTWYYYHCPIGKYWTQAGNRSPTNFSWTVAGSPNWANINYIQFKLHGGADIYQYVDGLYFGDIPVCRVAKNSTNITNNKLRFKLINDDVGKDDSLNASDDSGVIAQLAKAELLRCQTTPIVGSIAVAFIKDLLPGQLLHIHAKKTASGSFNINEDMRVTKIEHVFNKSGFLTNPTLTDDLINANVRQSFTEINTVLKAIRPEWQDRQASSIKAGTVDTTVPILEKDYPS